MTDSKDSFKMEPKSSSSSNTTTTTTSSSQKHHRTFIMTQNILRILVIVFTAVSVVVTVTNNQTVTLFSFQFEAHFYYSSSLKFFVVANSVVCFLSVLLLIFNLLRRRQQTHQLKDYCFFLFLFDLVMTVLLIAGCTATSAIGFVGQYGEDHVGWTPICNNVKKFCRVNLTSLLISYLAFFANLGLTVLIAYKCTS
ncbi:unnamed protein product [Lathyrus oleraceus]